MSFFLQPKPRHFHHETMFYDEHSDRVRQIEQRARRELGMDKANTDRTRNGGEPFNPYGIRGTFTESVKRKKARQGTGLLRTFSTNSGAIIVIILILLLVWLYLSR